MRRALLLALTFSGAALLALPEVLAQSGVMSGPPQVIKGAPGRPRSRSAGFAQIALPGRTAGTPVAG